MLVTLTSILVKVKRIRYNLMEEVKSVKTRLKELRARNGLNQTELAKRAKVSRQTISLIEREEFIPSLLIAVRIARIFNEAIESVFLFEEEEIE